MLFDDQSSDVFGDRILFVWEEQCGCLLFRRNRIRQVSERLNFSQVGVLRRKFINATPFPKCAAESNSNQKNKDESLIDKYGKQ